MKTIDELLSCIEDDIELMGENRIIYLMEEGDVVVDYDYLPSADYCEAVKLKNLQEELLMKKRQEKAEKTALKVGMIQMKVIFSSPQENLSRAADLVKKAKEQGSQICVLPECLDLGWGNPDALQLAEAIPGKISDRLCLIARENKVYLVAGMTEREGNLLYNTALLISDEGIILNKHRKINILSGVEDIYTVGDRLLVTQTTLGKIAVDICADNADNSLSIGMTLGRMGADILLSPCAWAVHPDYNAAISPYGDEWHRPYKKISTAFSIPVVGVSNVGEVTKGSWAGWKAIGNSIAYDSDGTLIQVLPYGEDQECVSIIDVHLTEKTVSGTALSERISRII